MIKKIIQRSPDLGVGIRLNKAVVAVAVAVVEKSNPKPPHWWGWAEANGDKLTKLEPRWGLYGIPNSPYGYWPGLWSAVVEGATSASWVVTFTPKVWLSSDIGAPVEDPSWEGEAIELALPQRLPQNPIALFEPQLVALPGIDFEGSNVSSWFYWEGAYSTPSFPELPIPRIVGAGNTLSVYADSKCVSGTLVAKATVDGKLLGSVELQLLRVNQVYSSG